MVAIVPHSKLHDLFLDSARSGPQRAAVCAGTLTISYQELDRLRCEISQAIASISGGAQRLPIGMLCSKGIPAYAAILGILASNNVYVPIDLSGPRERASQIILAAKLRILIVDEESSVELSRLLGDATHGYAMIFLNAGGVPLGVLRPSSLDTHSSMLPADSSLGVDGPPFSDDLAYIMFTSGSTGVPKGVPVSHASVVSMLCSLTKLLPVSECDRYSQFTDLTFDISIGELFLCWATGACLYAPSSRDKLDPIGFVRRNGLTVWSSVPTLAEFVMERSKIQFSRPTTLKMSLFCGEAMSLELARFWKKLSPEAALYNLYGPTEAAVYSTVYRFDESDPEVPDPLPIGLPLATVQVKIADASCGDCAKGELLLAGAQVFDGYLGGSPSTESPFVVDTASGDGWYKTGDIVSYSEEFGLLFRGRKDHQIKLRGYRIEMQEVEAALRAAVQGKAAVAVLRDQSSRPLELIAFVSMSAPADRTIREFLGARLPAYMLPRFIYRLPSFPINANGKTDYRALEGLARGMAMAKQTSINDTTAG